MGITHAKTSTHSDGADTTLILPSDWNADHVGGPVLLGTGTAHETVDTTLVSTVAVADVDSRLAVTLTAPPSGIVIVVISGHMFIVSGYTPWHGIREGSAFVSNGGATGASWGGSFVPFFGGGNQDGYRYFAFLIGGITAGSHTFKWSTWTDGGGASQVRVGPSWGDAVIRVFSLGI